MGGPGRINGKPHSETDNFGYCTFILNGVTFHSAEQYFQYTKCVTQTDRTKILQSGIGGDVWCAGNRVQLRSDWEDVKVKVMLDGNRAKFAQDATLAHALMSSTGPVTFNASSSFWCHWNGLIMELLRAELRMTHQSQQSEEKKDQQQNMDDLETIAAIHKMMEAAFPACNFEFPSTMTQVTKTKPSESEAAVVIRTPSTMEIYNLLTYESVVLLDCSANTKRLPNSVELDIPSKPTTAEIGSSAVDAYREMIEDYGPDCTSVILLLHSDGNIHSVVANAIAKHVANNTSRNNGRAQILTIDSGDLQRDYPCLFSEEFPNYAQQINENIFLGPKSHLTSESFFRDMNITHVLSILDQKATPCPFIPDAQHLSLLAQDSVVFDLLESNVLNEAVAFMEKAISSNNTARVFVHCHRGVSRSGSAVVAYLMKTQKQPLETVLADVKKCRPCVRPNKAFMEQLQAWELGVMEN